LQRQHHVRLESTVNLLVATLDLNLVRLVRGAMRAADARGDRLVVPAPTVEPRRRFHPEPLVEPRPHVRPEPFFEPRPVHRADDTRSIECPVPVEVSRTDAKSSTSPIQPPWKILPWEQPPAQRPRPIHKVKIVIGPADGCGKGNVIDLFI